MVIGRCVLFLFACLLALSGCTIDLEVLESMKDIQEDQRLLVAGPNATCSKRFEATPLCFGSRAEISPLSYKYPLANEEIAHIYAGATRQCVVTDSGKAFCWGGNQSGALGGGRGLQTDTSIYTPVEVRLTGSLAGKRIASLAVGSNFTCALDTGRGISCWGSNNYGQLGNGTSADSYVPVAVDTSGVLAGKEIATIVANGGIHICALDTEGAAYCWGYNGHGRLGNNSTVNSSVPVAVDMSGALAGKYLKSIAVGGSNTCGIADDNKAYCWGSNSDGGLGVNQSSTTLPSASTPQAVYTASGVLAGKDIAKIQIGSGFTCALTSDGVPVCWGNDGMGQLGNNTSMTDSTRPVAVKADGVLSGKTIKDIGVGTYHGCVLDVEGSSYCWGRNLSGGLGDNTTTTRPEPVMTNLTALPSDESFITLALGANSSCGLSDRKKLYCWGERSTIDGIEESIPTFYGWENSLFPDEELKYIRGMSLSLDQKHTCFVSSSYRVFCVGSNKNGALGTEAVARAGAPFPVDTSGVLAGKKLTEVHAGSGITYAVDDNRKLFAWGSNSYGGFANGGVSSIPALPLEVDLGEKRVKELAVGVLHTCILTFNSEVYCWGSNGFGQVGIGSSDPVVYGPSKVAGLLDGKKLTTISAFYGHTCVLTEEGRPYCWGLNYGSLISGGVFGAGNAIAITEPFEVSWPAELTEHRFISLTTAYFNTCALTETGKAYCWGDNRYGQLGVSGVISSPEPVAVETDKTFTKLIAGAGHFCGYTLAKEVYCWGDNSLMQMGDVLFTDPVALPHLVNGL